jgi:mRNA interferase MazF
VRIDPSAENGLRIPSEAMVDMIQTSSVRRVGKVIGHLDADSMEAVETSLMVHLGLV